MHLIKLCVTALPAEVELPRVKSCPLPCIDWPTAIKLAEPRNLTFYFDLRLQARFILKQDSDEVGKGGTATCAALAALAALQRLRCFFQFHSLCFLYFKKSSP